MKKYTIVFDLDGTLVDTAKDLASSTAHALSLIGVPSPAFMKLRPYVSTGARGMIEFALREANRGLPKADVDTLLERFLTYYEKNIAIESKPYPDVMKVLDGLKTGGMRLAVCTNKREKLARALLRELDMLKYFDAVTGRDTLPVHKPDPGHLIGTVILADGDLSRAIMVGDSETDIMTARSASIPVIAVSFGYTERPIQEFNPDVVIDHYSEFMAGAEKLANGRQAHAGFAT